MTIGMKSYEGYHFCLMQMECEPFEYWVEVINKGVQHTTKEHKNPIDAYAEAEAWVDEQEAEDVG